MDHVSGGLATRRDGQGRLAGVLGCRRVDGQCDLGRARRPRQWAGVGLRWQAGQRPRPGRRDAINVLGHGHFLCRHAVHMFPLKEVLWPDEGLALRWLKIGFVEFRKDVFAAAEQRPWCEFLRTGQAPAGAPGYLEEAATIIKYINLTGEEQAVIDLAEKGLATREAELKREREHGEARGEGRAQARTAQPAWGHGFRVGQAGGGSGGRNAVRRMCRDKGEGHGDSHGAARLALRRPHSLVHAREPRRLARADHGSGAHDRQYLHGARPRV